MQFNLGVLLSLWGFHQPTLDLAKDNQQRQVPNSWRYISIRNFRWLEFVHFGVVLRIGIYMDLYSYQSQVLLLDQHQDPKLLFSDTYIIGLQKIPCKKKKTQNIATFCGFVWSREISDYNPLSSSNSLIPRFSPCHCCLFPVISIHIRKISPSVSWGFNQEKVTLLKNLKNRFIDIA